ncbi:adhesin [Pseudomonas citri]|uniref:adhesin n=1 Tax=Pseudomonas citri TaxID=2978349 RepID=UPI0021B5BE2B|nr:adhesin [Pseudomonas citri]
MFKKIVSVTALGVAVLNPSWVSAAEDALTPIHITANIPNKNFYVQPRNPEFGKNEVMHFNPVDRRLTPVRQTFDVKHTEGSVHAYIEGARWLYNGRHTIPLLTTFNNALLDSIPREVVDDVTSTPGMQAEMVIFVPWPVSSNLSAGMYTGHFTVMFDAVPRVASL